MKNKIDLVNDCFSMLLRTGVTVNASPDDNTLALNRLEDMMAELESRNLATGYNFEDSPEPDSPSGLENWMNLAISQMLAMRVWPDFSPDEVNPMLARNSAQSSANLSARLAQQNALKYARRTPLGSGNQPYQQYNKFFGNYGATCGPSDAGSGDFPPAPPPWDPVSTNGLIERVGPATYEAVPITPFAKTLIDDADAAAARATIGAATFTDVPNLKSLPTGSNIQINTVYTVAALSSANLSGGGFYWWGATRDKATQDGSSVIAPEAIAAWDGTLANISQLEGWTGTGVGCWVLLGSNFAPDALSMEGRTLLSELPETNYYITNSSGVTDLPAGWPQGRYHVQQIGRTKGTYCTQIITNVSAAGNSGGDVARQAVRRMRTTGVWSDWFEELNTNSAIFKELTPNVANIAALKLRAGAFDNQRVFVSEYNTGTDVGGGSFVWNSTSTATANDVTIFAVTGVATGRWIRDWNVLTPEMAGAVLDNSTDSTAAIQRAVNAAIALGCGLYWADNVAVVTGSVTNFHAVVHTGNGAIRRGSDTFYITPSPSQTNTLYVSTSGSDTNDGLTAAFALRNGQRAVDVISARSALAIPGFWVVKFAAGTYSRIRYPDGGIITQNPITFLGADVGGHPNVPTTIISEGASVSAVGLRGWASDIIVSSIKFTGWRGTISSAGVSFGNNANVYLINAHFENCYYGASVAEHGQIDVKGGRFDTCGFLPSAAGGGAGIRGLFHVKFSAGTQNAGTLSGAPIFRGCYQAIFAQEHCNGHADYLDIADCERGISLNVNTRLNMDGTSLLRCSTYGVRALACSVPFISANTVFGTGADKCGINLITQDGSAANPSILTGFDNSSDDRYVSKTTADVSAGTSSTTIVESTFKAGFFADSNNTLNMSKSMNIVVYGECSGTAGGKRVQVRLGAETPASLTLPSTATGFFKAEFDVVFIGGASPAQRVYGLATSQNSVSHSVITDKAANFNADTLVKVEALKLDAADTVTIKGSLIKVSGI